MHCASAPSPRRRLATPAAACGPWRPGPLPTTDVRCTSLRPQPALLCPRTLGCFRGIQGRDQRPTTLASSTTARTWVAHAPYRLPPRLQDGSPAQFPPNFALPVALLLHFPPPGQSSPFSMSPFMGATNGYPNGDTAPRYTLLDGTWAALRHLLDRAASQLPQECLSHIDHVDFSTANTGSPYFPSPLKQTEAISALKAVEAGLAASIADLAYGEQDRSINVDLERASAFLFSTYLATVGGLDKAHPKVKKLLKGTRARVAVCRCSHMHC